MTGTDPVGVRVGETVTLTALVNGYPDQMVNWTLPGNGEVIQSYDPTKPANQLTPLGQAGQGSDAGYQVVQDESHITFEWVGAGTFYVSATVANQGSTSTTVNSGFFVQAPNVTVTAKTLSVPNTPTSHYKNGTVTSVDPGDPHDGSLQMGAPDCDGKRADWLEVLLPPNHHCRRASWPAPDEPPCSNYSPWGCTTLRAPVWTPVPLPGPRAPCTSTRL